MTHDYKDDLPCEKYRPVPVLKLLHDREIGRSRCRFKTNFVRYSENTYCDEEVIRSLYCDKNAYLETVACRKVPRAQNPAFCRGRLFTNNYQSWYNLYTSPTAGPMLMQKNIFSNMAPGAARVSTHGHITTQSPDCKIIDAVCVIHPYNCSPPNNMKWRGPQLLLLAKSGWLYQTDVENGEILDKIYIPTKHYADNFFDLDGTPPCSQEPADNIRRPSQQKFMYHYLTVNRVYENVIIKSSRTISNVNSGSKSITSTAFCILKLYPLSLYCHFVTDVSTYSTNPPYSAAVVNDFFIVTAMRQSKITFYSMEDIIKYYKLPMKVELKKRIGLRYANEWPYFTEATVGDLSLGVPYTMRNIDLDRFPTDAPVPGLFKTAAMKHSLQIGSSPYHYIIALNRNGTMWALRHLLGNQASETPPVKIQISDKWDGTHWSGVRFHNDDTGRVIKQDLNTVELLSIVHDGVNPFTHDSSSQVSCAVRSDFVIDVTPKIVDKCTNHEYRMRDMPPQITRSNAMLVPLPSQPNAGRPAPSTSRTTPSSSSSSSAQSEPHAISSRGRPIRRPVRWHTSSMHGADCSNEHVDDDEDIHLLVTVQYDYDLNLLALLYYRPKGVASPGWELREEGAELVVSIHDNYFGSKLASFVLEDDVSPSDRDFLSLAVDQDTMVYTRLRFNDHRCQYTVLRLNRRYGDSLPRTLPEAEAIQEEEEET